MQIVSSINIIGQLSPPRDAPIWSYVTGMANFIGKELILNINILLFKEFNANSLYSLILPQEIMLVIVLLLMG